MRADAASARVFLDFVLSISTVFYCFVLCFLHFVLSQEDRRKLKTSGKKHATRCGQSLGILSSTSCLAIRASCIAGRPFITKSKGPLQKVVLLNDLR